MYGDFAEPFDLYECQLAIIHCGSHDDTALIELLWQNIIDKGELILHSVPVKICYHFTSTKFLSNYNTLPILNANVIHSKV